MRTSLQLLLMVVLFLMTLRASNEVYSGAMALRLVLIVTAVIIAWKISSLPNRPVAIVGLVLSCIAAVAIGIDVIRELLKGPSPS